MKETPTKLYHGTNPRALRSILKDGLLPRRKTRKRSEWKACPSNKDTVHLTAAYALYFAINAAGLQEDAIIVEVNVEGLELWPDEDFVAQVLWSRREEISDARLRQAPSLNALTRLIKPAEFAQFWQNSLEMLGNVACPGVPAKRITRVARLTKGGAPLIEALALQPIIHYHNYQAVGDRYRGLLALIFDGTPLPPDPFATPDVLPLDRYNEALLAERAAAIRVTTINPEDS